jgi:excisionase family DNA binding protein
MAAEDSEMSDSTLKRLLSTEDAAEILDVSSRQVIYKINAGQIKATRVGRRNWIIREEDLDEYQAEQARQQDEVGDQQSERVRD